MGIDYESVLIVGYVLPEDEYSDEDKVDELVKKLGCEFVVFNDGYDTPPQYALVPKKFKKASAIKILNGSDESTKLFNDVQKIKEKADQQGIKLPEPVIVSKLCVW
jgi:hypothetical protein